MHLDKTAHTSIKMQLHDVGSSFSQIARELSLSPTTVITASQGKCTSIRVLRAIAQKLNSTPEQLWPERYKEEEKT